MASQGGIISKQTAELMEEEEEKKLQKKKKKVSGFFLHVAGLSLTEFSSHLSFQMQISLQLSMYLLE